MLLNVRNLSKAYGAVQVLENISFTINARERAGLVGPNGVGKSTLLRILTGQEEPEQGSISYAPLVEYGYLPQTTPDFYGLTIQDLIFEAVGNIRQLEERIHQLEEAMTEADEQQLPELLEAYTQVTTRFQDSGGYELDYRIDSVLSGLHIDYLPRTHAVATLSGGEKARVGLAALLLRSPGLLLLDEPTNHLDFASMDWLESYLSSYRGAALIVSHDRQFLNRVVTTILELDEHSHRLKRYEGNYDSYMQLKAAEHAKWEKDYERQQEEIKRLRKRIKESARQVGHSYRAPRDNDKFASYFFAQRVDSAIARNIHAAEERLRRIEANPIPKPPELLNVNSSIQAEPIASQVVIRLEHVSKRWG